MGYFPVRYDSRVVIYDRRGFIRLATVRPDLPWLLPSDKNGVAYLKVLGLEN